MTSKITPCSVVIGDYEFLFRVNATGCQIALSVVHDRTGQKIGLSHPDSLSLLADNGDILSLAEHIYHHTWSVHPEPYPVRTCGHPLCINPCHLVPMDKSSMEKFQLYDCDYLVQEYGVDAFGNPARKRGELTRGTSTHLAATPEKSLHPRERHINAGPFIAIIVENGSCWSCLGFYFNGDSYRICERKILAPMPTAVMRWRSSHGKVPAGYRLVQSCGDPYCLNPAHMTIIPLGAAPDYYLNPDMRKQWAHHCLAGWNISIRKTYEARIASEAKEKNHDAQHDAIAETPFSIVITHADPDYIAAIPGHFSARGSSRSAAIAALEDLVARVKKLRI